jgi:superfamily II DNA or RNA helicase
MARQQADFHKQTVLFQWALAQFGVSTLEEFKTKFQVNADSLGGLDEQTGQHRFFEQITNSVLARAGETVRVDRLAEYEKNIEDHTRTVNAARFHHGQPLVEWKYYQYLTLLFTELFLDRYFNDADGLRSEINEQIASHNDACELVDRVQPFDKDANQTADEQLAKLAFWSATGSGKTLLMHVHILQFRHYQKLAADAGKFPPLDQVIVVTPNDGLSRQHIEELEWSGFHAIPLEADQTSDLLTGQTRSAIKVISIHQLITEEEIKARREGGKKFSTSGVVTQQMAGRNLVLVDEGHRGAAKKAEIDELKGWLARRDSLAKGGFAIEYSATFKEAAQGDEDTRNRYARSILIDYAYRSFYRDGFGKDFNILNLEDDDKQRRYLTAALLLFYQQMKVWMDGGEAMKPYLIDKPLWVFVGHTVVGKAGSNQDDQASISDVVEVLLFVKQFLETPAESIQLIKSIIEEGFVNSTGRNLLYKRLPHLEHSGDIGALAIEIHTGILTHVFQAPGGGNLCVQLLKSADGELALKVGQNDPFGVVNVGDPGAVADACERHSIIRLEDDQNRDSLFQGINHNDSSINLLVGSRKFTEGWNSWRVSSLGLMRMGKNEGTQIIQLFGRGVRLRGYKMCLRRSSVLADKPTPPKNLRQVETLQVFGVKATYMNKFRDWIFSEIPEAQDKQVWELPVVDTLPTRTLKTIQLKETIEGEKVERGQAFRVLGPLVKLRPPHETAPEDVWLRKHKTRLNWLPRIRGIVGQNKQINNVIGEATLLPERQFGDVHRALLNYDDLLFGLEAFKASRGLDRLHADQNSIRQLFAASGWYRLHATAEDMRTDRYENISQWQRMAGQLLNSYAERLYRFVRGRWEAPYIEVVDLTMNDPSMMKEGDHYLIESTELAESVDDIATIEELVVNLRDVVKENKLAPWRQWTGNWRTVPFAGHLYQPLLHVGKRQMIKISPVALDRHESKFVEDLAAWCVKKEDIEIYLLRNKAVTGLGFFQAANFFPDFLLWLQDGETQHLVFADPKGLQNPELSDPKLQFATRDIPLLQRIIDAQGSQLRLSAFILSSSLYSDLEKNLDGERISSKAELEELGMLFMYDDPETYIGKMVQAIRLTTGSARVLNE